MPDRLENPSPSISVRAMAEMLRLPAYEQVRILTEQKYPKQEPQIFRTPYYQPALTGIREFYRLGGNGDALVQARSKSQLVKQLARRTNNIRVLDRFEAGDQARRKLSPQKNFRGNVMLGTVEIRLSGDLTAEEEGNSRLLFYNCRSVPLDKETAKTAIEIAHWAAEACGRPYPRGSIEYVDLHANQVYKAVKKPTKVIQLVRSNVKIIEALWPGI